MTDPADVARLLSGDWISRQPKAFQQALLDHPARRRGFEHSDVVDRLQFGVEVGVGPARHQSGKTPSSFGLVIGALGSRPLAGFHVQGLIVHCTALALGSSYPFSIEGASSKSGAVHSARNGTRNRLNIQPVVPFDLNAEWNVISRTIVPVVWQDNTPADFN